MTDTQFPSRRKDLLVEVFYIGVGTPPFICGVDGHATTNVLEEIETMLVDEADLAEYTTFEKGEGTYLFKAVHEPADEGCSAYWELEQIAFEPTPAPDLGEDDRG